MNTQTNQPIDPALGEYLQTLLAVAAEIGAAGCWVIRGATMAHLTYSPDAPVVEAAIEKLAEELRKGNFDISLNTDIRLDIEDAGVLVLIRFPASDGGESGIEYSDGQ
jgi:hypothetical protein